MKQLLRSHKFVLLAIITGAALFLFAPTTTNAATITVNSTDDTTTQDDGNCTLREAINNINSGSDTTDGGGGGDCPAGDGNDDTVNLPSGTITLTSDLPTITESTTITGQGMGVTTIDGDGQWAPFRISNGLVISDVTIKSAMDVAIFGTGDIDVSRVEVDGENWAISDPVSGFAGAIVVYNTSAQIATSSVKDVHIHNFNVDVAQFYGLGAVGGNGNEDIDLIAERVTIANIANTGSVGGVLVGAGMFDLGATEGTVHATFDNFTISDIESSTSSATGIVLTILSQSNNQTDLDIRNTTITNITPGGINPVLDTEGAALAVVGAANNSIIDVSMFVTNTVLSAGNAENCIIGDYSSEVGMSGGIVNTTLTSLGGNLSDDTSCNSYFTQPTDQNNLTNLASTLGTLGDYGGSVPTIPLLEGSPAIDAGVTVAGLTSDARGVSRPLGLAYDSGAYESPFTKPTSTESLAETGGGSIQLVSLSLILMLLGGVIHGRRQRENTLVQ